MSLESIVAGVRRAVGLFDMSHRGLIEVRGEERVRWLDGMISGNIQALEDAGIGAGCYATLLTNRGAIVADLHVGRFEDRYLLESLRSEIPRICETLERYIIADDVTLEDRSDAFAALGLEGPLAPALIEKATDADVAPLPTDAWAESMIAGRNVLIAAFGFSGEPAYQIRMIPEDRQAVKEELTQTLETDGFVHGDLEALEVLRVEAGIPALGAELDEEVLPPEARLERAIATDKGCYVGQEIVARLRARGQVNHLLVGFRIESESLPAVGIEIFAGGRATGELTSVVRSPTMGVIALGYVRREHADAGTLVEFESGRAHVTMLPFVTEAALPRPNPDRPTTSESKPSGAT